MNTFLIVVLDTLKSKSYTKLVQAKDFWQACEQAKTCETDPGVYVVQVQFIS